MQKILLWSALNNKNRPFPVSTGSAWMCTNIPSDGFKKVLAKKYRFLNNMPLPDLLTFYIKPRVTWVIGASICIEWILARDPRFLSIECGREGRRGCMSPSVRCELSVSGVIVSSQGCGVTGYTSKCYTENFNFFT